MQADIQAFFHPESGPVPEVNPANLRRMWVSLAEKSSNHATDLEVLKAEYGPQVDVMSLAYRAWMLELLVRLGELTPWMHDNNLEDAVFAAVAVCPMQRMEIGVVMNAPPLDIEDLRKRVEAEAAK